MAHLDPGFPTGMPNCNYHFFKQNQAKICISQREPDHKASGIEQYQHQVKQHRNSTRSEWNADIHSTVLVHGDRVSKVALQLWPHHLKRCEAVKDYTISIKINSNIYKHYPLLQCCCAYVFIPRDTTLPTLQTFMQEWNARDSETRTQDGTFLQAFCIITETGTRTGLDFLLCESKPIVTIQGRSTKHMKRMQFQNTI